VEQRLVKTRLVLVGHDQDAVLGEHFDRK
jgi:hypothetical protein